MTIINGTFFFNNYGFINYYSKVSAPLFSNYTYELHSLKGKKIQIGDVVKLYIKKEISNLKSTNDSIIIDNCSYRYLGRNPDITSTFSSSIPGIQNESTVNFLEHADNIVLFDGLIDFEIEN